ncbi:MAG: YitT family protein, partial [Oscillospiraceae bacterium]
LWNTPIGGLALAFNLPLLLLGYHRIGHTFILNTLRVVVLTSLATDVVTAFLAPYAGQSFLAALFGGALVGAGLGLVFMRGGSTGGTDIIVKLIKLKKPHLSLGTIMMLTDLLVVGAAACIYRSLEAAMMGIVMLYTSTTVIDRMISGLDARRLVMVVTPKQHELAALVLTQLTRGATLLPAEGAYSGQTTGLLLCVVENQQLFHLKQLVQQVDPTAFVIVAQATEILGVGFKSIESQ